MEQEKIEEIDWSAYAAQYDLLCEQNDSYEENVKDLLAYIRNLPLEPDCRIADIGAGTGNFICEVANLMPTANFTHIDSNREMNRIALAKYAAKDLNTVQVIEEDIRRLELHEPKFDLIICVNALYAMPPQELILSKFKSWLSENGKLYLIDLGRKMDSMDWGLHFLRQSVREKRLLDYLSTTFLKGKEVIKQNRMTTIAQESGRYWMHDTENFGETLRAAGFRVEKLQACYRGYADLAICSSES